MDSYPEFETRCPHDTAERCGETAKLDKVSMPRFAPDSLNQYDRAALNRHLAKLSDGSASDPAGMGFALLRLDLGSVAWINDRQGWVSSDLLIADANRRLRGLEPTGAFVAHLGGGSFAVVSPAGLSVPECEMFAAEIATQLGGALTIDGVSYPFEASIGWAMLPHDAEESELLFVTATAALALARSSDRCDNLPQRRIQRATVEIAKRHFDLVDLEHDLKRAIQENEFTLNWLPIMETANERVMGFEALARWSRPGHGDVMPDDFLPLASTLGLVEQIDRKILLAACLQAKEWREPLCVSVNISPRWLETERLSVAIAETLAETGLDPRRLQIELSERGRFGAPDSARKEFARLKALGVRLILDDFGTGVASLERLANYPFDQVKLDPLFIRRVGSDRRVEAILSATLHMVHALDMTCCAEGVETEEQVAFLHAHGCEEIQGYLIGRPRILPPTL